MVKSENKNIPLSTSVYNFLAPRFILFALSAKPTAILAFVYTQQLLETVKHLRSREFLRSAYILFLLLKFILSSF